MPTTKKSEANYLIKCDGEKGCGAEFYIRELESEDLPEGRERIWFECPDCGKIYEVLTREKLKD